MGEFNKRKTFAKFRKHLTEELPYHRETKWQKEELRSTLRWKQDQEVGFELEFEYRANNPSASTAPHPSISTSTHHALRPGTKD